MKSPKKFTKFSSISSLFLAIALIALVAIIFKFDGLIKLNLGKDGGEFLFDGRSHRELVK